jgi:hypothetical protein
LIRQATAGEAYAARLRSAAVVMRPIRDDEVIHVFGSIAPCVATDRTEKIAENPSKTAKMFHVKHFCVFTGKYA